MKEFHLTDIKTGEKVGNFKSLGEKDIVIGDRVLTDANNGDIVKQTYQYNRD
jgi:hypothetical protein